jgi:hypothetical protein
MRRTHRFLSGSGGRTPGRGAGGHQIPDAIGEGYQLLHGNADRVVVLPGLGRNLGSAVGAVSFRGIVIISDRYYNEALWAPRPQLRERARVRGRPKPIFPHLSPLPEGEETIADSHGNWIIRCSVGCRNVRAAVPPPRVNCRDKGVGRVDPIPVSVIQAGVWMSRPQPCFSNLKGT